MESYNARAIVLAAGKSTRFKTKKSKLLFNICGQTMILYPLRIFELLNIPVTLVLGYQAEDVIAEVEQSAIKDVSFVIQEQQLGTGHAVACTKSTWDNDDIIIMNGDMPLITREQIEQLLTEHAKKNAVVSFLTSDVIDPTGYGRVMQNNGRYKVIEEKDCTSEQRNINCINAGLYIMKRSFLEQYIPQLEKSAVTGEIYLPDLISNASNVGHIVNPISVPFDFVRGVNTLQELWGVEQIKRSEYIKNWMAQGVQFELAQSIHIDINVEIGAGSFIGTGVHLLGDTKIGEECFVGAFTIIEDTTIGDGTNIHSHSVIQDSVIGSNVHVGPFARLRNNVTLADGAQVGNFVEVKNATIGADTKAKHLSYLGDATIGSDVNIGAGTIICNYDGVKKDVTIIEDGAFIGSNNTLIAPVTIGEKAYTAAGSTITGDVPAHALAIGRSPQVNKKDYAHKLKASLSSELQTATCVEKNANLVEDQEDEEFQFTGAVKTDADHKIGF